MQHISQYIAEPDSSFITNSDKRISISRIIMSIAFILAFSGIFFATHLTRAEEMTPADILSDISSAITGITTVADTEVLVDGLTEKQRAEKIDNFFASKGNLPLTGQGIVFVRMADKYGLDWRLVASIAFAESTGGKFACSKDEHNVFGWGSCRGQKFDSYKHAIETVTLNLAGHNPNTERYYKGKTLAQIIDMYNPPHVRADYNSIIKSTMGKIAKTEISETSNQLAMK